MKAEINDSGTLLLTPETGIEAYALARWYETSQKSKVEGRATTITINLSQFPGAASSVAEATCSP